MQMTFGGVLVTALMALFAARSLLHGQMKYSPSDQWLFRAFWQALRQPDRAQRQTAQGCAMAYAGAGLTLLWPIIFGA